MKNIKVLQPIPLTKRILYYVLLIGITLLGLFFALFLGGRGHKIGFYVICMYLIPQCVFGAFFFKTKLIFKFIVSFATTIISSAMLYLIVEIGFFDVESVMLLLVGLFFPIIIVWETAYQILKIKS